MSEIEFNYQLLSLQNSLNSFALSLTKNVDEASDLVQDTYLKAIIYRDKFDAGTNRKAWTYTIMKNTFINNYRREVRLNAFIDSTDDIYHLNAKSTMEAERPDSSLHAKEIQKSIQSLGEEHRIPFLMHTRGYKYKEIADQMNLSIGTVKSRIFFGRKKLMEILRDYQN